MLTALAQPYALAQGTEPEIWAQRAKKVESHLDFWIGFLGVSRTRDKIDPITQECRERILALIRAVSWVESHHGTGAGNYPSRDPMQAAHPRDAHWSGELFGPGKGSRIIRGVGKSNLWYRDIVGEAQTYHLPDCAWSHLIRGAARYNGGGDPQYEAKIRAALTAMGYKVN